MNIGQEIGLVKRKLISASNSMSGILRKSGRSIAKDTHATLGKIQQAINIAISKLEAIEKTIQ